MTETKYLGKCLLVEKKGKKILVVGDLHLGYEESLGIGGVKLGENVFNESVEYINRVIEEAGEKGKRLANVRGARVANSRKNMIGYKGDKGDSNRRDNTVDGIDCSDMDINNITDDDKVKLCCDADGIGELVDEFVLLGDVKQEFGEIRGDERENIIKFLNWADEKMNKKGKVVIVKGNHDVILEPILQGKKRVELVDKYIIGGVLFIHGDKKIKEINNSKCKVIVMGHWHPAAELSEEMGVKRERYKCFLYGKQKGKEWIIVPSFSEQRYGKDIRYTSFNKIFGLKSEMFNAFVVSDKELEVLDFGKLGKLNQEF